MIEQLPALLAYQPALLALAVLCLCVLLQSLLVAPLGFASGAETPGMPLKGSHIDRSFRVIRTYQNSVENLPAFIGVLIVALVVGVNATWVNWLAGIHLGARLLYWACYYSGVGANAGGPRSLAYVAGLLSNAILAGMTIFTVLV